MYKLGIYKIMLSSLSDIKKGIDVLDVVDTRNRAHLEKMK